MEEEAAKKAIMYCLPTHDSTNEEHSVDDEDDEDDYIDMPH